VLALASSGVPVEAISAAIESGELSLAFVDDLAPDPVPLVGETHVALIERVGLSSDLARRLANMLGTSSLPRDGQVRADHRELYELVTAAAAEGVSEDRLVRYLQATIDGIRRIVDAERDFIEDVVVTPLVQSGATASEILARSAAPRRRYHDLGRRLSAILLDRFVDEAIFQDVTLGMEAALGNERVPARRDSGAIAFMDVSGYTRLAEEAGDEEAAAQAARFSQVVADVSADFGGELVKVLGDGVMVYFGDVDKAVRAAIAVVERLRNDDLPAARVGINAGPMIRRDGDYFGSVVNIAARAADAARPYEVVVTDGVVDATQGGADLHFYSLGAFKLRNVRHTVELYQARREEPTFVRRVPRREAPRRWPAARGSLMRSFLGREAALIR
jgi:adenylate cyclase